MQDEHVRALVQDGQFAYALETSLSDVAQAAASTSTQALKTLVARVCDEGILPHRTVINAIRDAIVDAPVRNSDMIPALVERLLKTHPSSPGASAALRSAIDIWDYSLFDINLHPEIARLLCDYLRGIRTRNHADPLARAGLLRMVQQSTHFALYFLKEITAEQLPTIEMNLGTLLDFMDASLPRQHSPATTLTTDQQVVCPPPVTYACLRASPPLDCVH